MADENIDKVLKLKPFLTQTRKIGGRIVQQELVAPTFDEDEALDGLLEGVDTEDIEEGRDKLMRENPGLARQGIYEMLDITASDAGDFTDPIREAGVKRAGMIALKDTGDTVNFKRIAGGRLDLDDLRPQVGQHPPGGGDKGPHRHFHDLDPCERLAHASPFRRVACLFAPA